MIMATSMTHADTSQRELVIVLHCSDSHAGQWTSISQALGKKYEVVTPAHFGVNTGETWHGNCDFSLAREAARTIAIIDQRFNKVHLVGHSYGGAVALHVAARRPHRIASLSLYEPTALHLLAQQGDAGTAALDEASSIAGHITLCVCSGDYRSAAQTYINYWCGDGSWVKLSRDTQNSLIRSARTAPLEFRALFEERDGLSTYARLRIPCHIIRGERTPAATRIIANALQASLPTSRTTTIANAGHIGPITHAEEVDSLVRSHIDAFGLSTTRRHDAIQSAA